MNAHVTRRWPGIMVVNIVIGCRDGRRKEDEMIIVAR